jgi:hypothetical protein
VLALLAAFKRIPKAEVKLRLRVDVVGVELVGLEDGKELRVPGEHGIGTEIGGRLQSLGLKDGRARGLQSVVVLQSQANGFLDRNARRGGLSRGRPGWRRWGGHGVLLRCRKSRQGQQGQGRYKSFSQVDDSSCPDEKGRLAIAIGTEQGNGGWQARGREARAEKWRAELLRMRKLPLEQLQAGS